MRVHATSLKHDENVYLNDYISQKQFFQIHGIITFQFEAVYPLHITFVEFYVPLQRCEIVGVHLGLPL